MSQTLTREDILRECCEIASTQPGGTLATMHAEDGTPYVTFVLFHLREDGLLLFGSGTGPQHSRNMSATPEVSFLIDNRDVIKDDWTAFNRIVIEGHSEAVDPTDANYAGYLASLAQKNRMAAYFTEHGVMYAIHPRRIILMKGFEPDRHIIHFE
jgi:nitroimidazol reductase NimA-like FMN-containing flavoprotein (pyridoxamine 5'-phosphate oxidase superfamily)